MTVSGDVRYEASSPSAPQAFSQAVLHYTGTASSTRELETLSVTPQIWRQESTGDVLVYSGTPTICSDTYTCSVAGDFVPAWDDLNVTGTFVANVTTSYTLATADAAALGLDTKTYKIINDISTDAPVSEVTVTGPLTPVPPGTTVSAEDANNTVPWGGTVKHTLVRGVNTTIVYDASGNPKGWADDAESEIIPVPNGDITTVTWITSLPSEALIDEADEHGELITNNTTGEPILSIITSDEALAFRKAQQAAGTPAFQNSREKRYGLNIQDVKEGWVEWAEMTFDSSAPSAQSKGMSNFHTEWDIPSEPKAPVDNASEAVWMGIQPTDAAVANGTTSSVFQNVLMYNWKNDKEGHTFPKNWSAAIWHVSSNGYDLSDRIGPLSSGNTVTGTINYLVLSNPPKWCAQLNAGGTSKTMCSNASIGKVDQKNVTAYVTFEAYTFSHSPALHDNGYDDQYFFKNVKFKNFAITNAKTIPESVDPNFSDYMNTKWYNKIGKSTFAVNHLGVTIHSTTAGKNDWIVLNTTS